MKTITLNLGINEQATIAKNKIYDDKQIQLHQYTAHDIIYEYTPNFNGGYIIFIEPGPWVDLVNNSSEMVPRFGQDITKFPALVREFITNSMKLAYQITPGDATAATDNYNIRHINQNLFSHTSQISNVSITYLEEKNIVEYIHSVWLAFMDDLKNGFVELPDQYLAKDTDTFFPVTYYGQIWAYAFNPIDLRPREIVKYIGVFPTSDNLQDSFGQRGNNNHYMKNINYSVVDYDRAVYQTTDDLSSKDHFNNFVSNSKLFADFTNTASSYGLLR